MLATDRPLAWIGRVLQAGHNRLLPRREAVRHLDFRLVRERNVIRRVLGQKWHQAVLLSAGRLGFDYLSLLAAVRATGSHARPSLVLLAYAVAGIIGLVPITPGGLGIVEASLSALLILAGVDGGAAVLATLTYRLMSYWLPLAAGPFAGVAYRRRYGAPPTPSSDPTAPAAA